MTNEWGKSIDCERLDEIGFNIDGGFTKYVKVPAKLLWSLDPLRGQYSDDDVFRLGSMVEPTSVAYNAVIQAMASGMNMLPMMTKEIGLEEVPDNIVLLRTDRTEYKISCRAPGAATK